ncbi:SIS domain-containing protein [Amycolatopsis vancoresmycina]|uniref:Tagatose-6-phosphate ketose/aldose isomerase n=1 Tax=Amycolatopsis vancoresmycina DSM 44592 TaxID=1292037 RepID=R1HD78_9PSEU|nr:SIS domain-containing protein [Amycolatopsis vancoresmycina]EOD58401.1 tagatose-6-phosphate ketose/aldose isomerase [Amycolatopsis vancoresmycina DSM 44592]
MHSSGRGFGDSRTAREIGQQPATWLRVAEAVRRARPEIAELLGLPGRRIVLTGAGTSAFVGEVVARDLARHLGRPVEAIATTDIVADPLAVVVDERPILLVSFARSGNSPESVAAADLLDRLTPGLRHLVITCDPAGRLARRWSGAAGAVVVALPDEVNDRGFAMTSSFTGMALAALLAFGVDVDVEALARAGTAVLEDAAEHASAVSGAKPARLVFLGSGPLLGLAREAALKCLELTRGEVVGIADSALGFRHGPKSVLDERTVAVVFLSADPHTRRYDADIARELVQSLGEERVVVVGDGTGTGGARVWPVPSPSRVPVAGYALLAVLAAQTTALACSLALGITPDNPFPGGEVNRVVQGVVIHEFVPPEVS